MKLISIITPCFNEEENVRDVCAQVRQVMETVPQYQYEHIFIDNASKDRTVEILKELAAEDQRIKIIVNTRNFGHIRSPYHAYLQARGDAVISIVCDLQDPPFLILDFIKKWEEGYQVVMGVKSKSQENGLMFGLRRLYYRTLRRLSDTELVENFTGFGLYDRRVIDTLKTIDEPYPYFRGLIAELGFRQYLIDFVQPVRKKGKTKNNFYTLFDMAMLGLTNHSKVPLRFATIIGFISSGISFLTGFAYLIYKIVYWNSFSVGVAPIVLGLFFFSSVQLFFLGVVGEYVGSIHTQVKKRPLVIERERVNFD